MLANAEAAAIMNKLFGGFDKSGNGNGDAGFAAVINSVFSAKGNIFSGGALVPFANGGIFDSPQFFPMANGGLGVFGEAGPEAIMPLTRGPGGTLGVRASGAGGGNVYAPNVQVDARGNSGISQAQLQGWAAYLRQVMRIDIMTFQSTGQFSNG
jgi:lambda family phage tail tape measure protein